MNIQAAVKSSDQTAQAGLSLSDRTYRIVGNLMSQLVPGAKWLNGRVLDSRPRGHRLEPHQIHCVVSLSNHGRIQRGDRGSGPPLKNHKNIGFLSNTGPGPLATKPAFNVGPTSARQRNAI